MKSERRMRRVTGRDVLAGVALALALVIVHLGLLIGSAAVPGTPLNESLQLMGPMAGKPTDAEIRAWFQAAEAVVVFGSVVVPVLTPLVACAVRFTLPSRPVRWFIAGFCWLAFFFTFAGIGRHEFAGAVAFVAILGTSDFIARKRTDAGSAA